MSWFFGSHKKKEPTVTIDPTPIDNGFYCVQASQQPQPHSLYPNLNGGAFPQIPPSSLPYNVSPNTPTPLPRTTSLPMRASSVEPSNQLESIPFRISANLQSNSSGTNHIDGLSSQEFAQNLNKLKRILNSSELDYDFSLERRIVREANMVQNHVAY